MMKSWIIKIFRILTVLVILYSFCNILNQLFAKYEIGVTFSTHILEVFLPIAIAIVMIDVSYSLNKISNKAQTQNIKIQLFDKRFEVYRCVVKVNNMVCDSNISKQGLVFDVVVSNYNHLLEMSLLSRYIFEDELYQKIVILTQLCEELINKNNSNSNIVDDNQYLIAIRQYFHDSNILLGFDNYLMIDKKY